MVELRDQARVEIDPAHLGDRVDEVVELPGRGNRKVEEDRLGREHGEHRGVPVAEEGQVSPAEQPHQPDDGEAHIERPVSEVERRDQTASRQEQLLQPRLDMNAEPLLERDDPLRILVGPFRAVAAQREAPYEQVDGVETEADRHLAGHREALRLPARKGHLPQFLRSGGAKRARKEILGRI